MFREKLKDIISVNIISLVLLGLSIVVFFVGEVLVEDNEMIGAVGAIILLVVAAVYALIANYNLLLKKPVSPTAGLEKFRKEPSMRTDIDAIIIAYKSIEQRETIFDDSESPGAMEIYEKAKAQVENNIESAKKFCSTYDYISKPEIGYLHGLAIECTEIVSKLNEIIIERIDVDNSVRDEDLRIMDDYLDSLQSLKGR